MRMRLIGAIMSIGFLFSTESYALERTPAAIKVVKTYKAKVSWYKHGIKTANGEVFNPYAYTAAHKTLPFGTLVKFTNMETNTYLIARINDRGPFIKNREFDLTLKCAIHLGIKKDGVVILKIEIMG